MRSYVKIVEVRWTRHIARMKDDDDDDDDDDNNNNNNKFYYVIERQSHLGRRRCKPI